MDGSERRTAQRGHVDLRVRYRHPDGREAYATIDNISHAGVLLVGGEALPTGTHLDIEFDDPAGRRHEISGNVVRSAPKGGFAVAFVRIDDITLEFIRDALDRG